MSEEDKILQAAWEQLTLLVLHQGFGVLWMKHFIEAEFIRLCDDPIMRAKIGVEPKRALEQGACEK